MNLTFPKRHDGIDAQGAKCRNGAGQKGDQQGHRRQGEKYERIDRTDALEQ
jgi:hypothetical protein